MARRNGSQELAEATLPKTIALGTKNHGPIIKPKAPTRSAKILGKRKQEEMSKKARTISSFGKEIRRFHIQVMKAKYMWPKVMAASLAVGVTSFMVTLCAAHYVEPSQIKRLFLPGRTTRLAK